MDNVLVIGFLCTVLPTKKAPKGTFKTCSVYGNVVFKCDLVIIVRFVPAMVLTVAIFL